MAGFGSGPFGTGSFGRAAVAFALGFGQMPELMQIEDETGDLQREREMFGELVQQRYAPIADHYLLRAPITTNGFAEEAETAAVSAVSVVGQDLTITLTSAADDLLWRMFPTSGALDNTAQIYDGWSAVIDALVYPVTAVDAFARTFTLRTDRLPADVGATIELRPPDLLTLHGGMAGLLVDRLDVPDYTRRALYRSRLIRDWKVTDQVFRLVGRLYGFDVQVTALWCITAAIAAGLTVTNPANVFELNGKFYTDLPYKRHRYDAVPADLIAMDEDEDVQVAASASAVIQVNPITLLPAAGTGWWSVQVAAAVTNLINVDASGVPLGRVLFQDSAGTRHWIERVALPSSGLFYVASTTAPALGAGFVIFEADFACNPDWRRAALYNIDITPTEVLTEPGADLTRLIARMEEKVSAYVPIHIRVARRRIVLNGIAASPLFAGAVLSGQVFTVDQGQTANPFNADSFDAIPADQQPMDTGRLVPSGSLTYSP
jgi:hypothetical protein